MKDGCRNFGAQIERGRVIRADEDGYVVESLDRPGIISPPIGSMARSAPDAGEQVYFALFADGSGFVIAASSEITTF